MSTLPQSELDRRKKDAATRRKRVQWQTGEVELIPSTRKSHS